MRKSLLRTSACSSPVLLLKYVVKRPFRSYDVVYEPGVIIDDPSVVKLFQQRVTEGKIMQVTEQGLENAIWYFTERHGLVDFGDKLRAAFAPVKPVVKAPVAKPPAEK